MLAALPAEVGGATLSAEQAARVPDSAPVSSRLARAQALQPHMACSLASTPKRNNALPRVRRACRYSTWYPLAPRVRLEMCSCRKGGAQSYISRRAGPPACAGGVTGNMRGL